jgi:hypothetical protein
MTECFMCGVPLGHGAYKGMCINCFANNLALKQSQYFKDLMFVFKRAPDGWGVFKSVYNGERRMCIVPPCDEIVEFQCM